MNHVITVLKGLLVVSIVAMAEESLPSEPHQPQSFVFPRREFGINSVVKRSFQASWFTRWTWLHYRESQDSVICHLCARASLEKKLNWSNNAEAAFISKGFSNWKHAVAKFNAHAESKCHKEALMKVVVLPSTTLNVAESLSQQTKKKRLKRRQNFLKILSNVKFLARQGTHLWLS